MNSVCVFCGSSVGSEPRYAATAAALGRLLATRKLRLVYGGGSVGLMGVIADAALAGGGSVTGVIPRTLWEREVGHRELTDLHIVETMHERKALMAQLSDGFIALPGGIGTLDEFFEIWTWGQLGVHDKPFGFLNVDGYYAALLAFLNHMQASAFIRPEYLAMLHVETDAARLLARFEAYNPPTVAKWVDRRGV